MEVQDRPSGLVSGGDAQRGQPGGRPAGLQAVTAQSHDLGAGGEGVADPGQVVQAQAPVEQVGYDVVGDQRGLADRHVGDQPGMCDRAAGDSGGQVAVQGQSEAVAEDGLVAGGQAVGERDGRGAVVDLSALEVVEERAAHRPIIDAHDY